MGWQQRVTVLPLGSLWAVRADSRQTVTAYGTEAEAIAAAGVLLSASGGGELIVKDRVGTIVHSESFPPSQ